MEKDWRLLKKSNGALGVLNIFRVTHACDVVLSVAFKIGDVSRLLAYTRRSLMIVTVSCSGHWHKICGLFRQLTSE